MSGAPSADSEKDGDGSASSGVLRAQQQGLGVILIFIPPGYSLSDWHLHGANKVGFSLVNLQSVRIYSNRIP